MVASIERGRGFSISNDFFFDTRLEFLGKWRRQLIAESLGKRHDTMKDRIGITLIVFIGSIGGGICNLNVWLRDVELFTLRSHEKDNMRSKGFLCG